MDKPNAEYRSVDRFERDTDKVITPVESRQGIMLGRMRWVLAISLVLVLIAFVSLYAVHFGSNPHVAAQLHGTTTTATSG
jgi:hypothetical protein